MKKRNVSMIVGALGAFWFFGQAHAADSAFVFINNTPSPIVVTKCDVGNGNLYIHSCELSNPGDHCTIPIGTTTSRYTTTGWWNQKFIANLAFARANGDRLPYNQCKQSKAVAGPMEVNNGDGLHVNPYTVPKGIIVDKTFIGFT